MLSSSELSRCGPAGCRQRVWPGSCDEEHEQVTTTPHLLGHSVLSLPMKISKRSLQLDVVHPREVLEQVRLTDLTD
jgi:hypothetical protein